MQERRSSLARLGCRPAAALLALLGAGLAQAQTVQARCEIYPKGQDRAAAVVPCTFSQRQGYVAIDRADGVRHELRPTSDQPGTYVDEMGRSAYRNRGLGSRGQIYRLADQSVYVYWDTTGQSGAAPAAASTGGTAVGAAGAAATVAAPAAFDRTFKLQGITFRVRSPNNPSMNTLDIVPSGLKADNRPISQRIDGIVTDAEVADLNADGSPEIYVYVASAGAGSGASIVAYSSNQRRSLSEISLPPIDPNRAALKGYRGREEVRVVENRLVRRFPVYRDGDTDDKPTGGWRQLQYKLARGEAGWIFRLDRTVEY